MYYYEDAVLFYILWMKIEHLRDYLLGRVIGHSHWNLLMIRLLPHQVEIQIHRHRR